MNMEGNYAYFFLKLSSIFFNESVSLTCLLCKRGMIDKAHSHYLKPDYYFLGAAHKNS